MDKIYPRTQLAVRDAPSTTLSHDEEADAADVELERTNAGYADRGVVRSIEDDGPLMMDEDDGYPDPVAVDPTALAIEQTQSEREPTKKRGRPRKSDQSNASQVEYHGKSPCPCKRPHRGGIFHPHQIGLHVPKTSCEPLMCDLSLTSSPSSHPHVHPPRSINETEPKGLHDETGANRGIATPSLDLRSDYELHTKK